MSCLRADENEFSESSYRYTPFLDSTELFSGSGSSSSNSSGLSFEGTMDRSISNHQEYHQLNGEPTDTEAFGSNLPKQRNHQTHLPDSNTVPQFTQSHHQMSSISHCDGIDVGNMIPCTNQVAYLYHEQQPMASSMCGESWTMNGEWQSEQTYIQPQDHLNQTHTNQHHTLQPKMTFGDAREFDLNNNNNDQSHSNNPNVNCLQDESQQVAIHTPYVSSSSYVQQEYQMASSSAQELYEDSAGSYSYQNRRELYTSKDAYGDGCDTSQMLQLQTYGNNQDPNDHQSAQANGQSHGWNSEQQSPSLLPTQVVLLQDEQQQIQPQRIQFIQQTQPVRGAIELPCSVYKIASDPSLATNPNDLDTNAQSLYLQGGCSQENLPDQSMTSTQLNLNSAEVSARGQEAENPSNPNGRRGRQRRKSQRSKAKLNGKLWEFIRDLLLNDHTNPSFIRWERREDGIFKFVQSDKVAKMWGERKQNPKMTYEKLSRAMRYYYKSKVLLPVFGRRLVYKFGPNATGWLPASNRNVF